MLHPFLFKSNLPHYPRRADDRRVALLGRPSTEKLFQHQRVEFFDTRLQAKAQTQTAVRRQLTLSERPHRLLETFDSFLREKKAWPKRIQQRGLNKGSMPLTKAAQKNRTCPIYRAHRSALLWQKPRKPAPVPPSPESPPTVPPGDNLEFRILREATLLDCLTRPGQASVQLDPDDLWRDP